MAVDRTREWFLQNQSKTGLYIHYHRENAEHLLSQAMSEAKGAQSYMAAARAQVRASLKIPYEALGMIDELVDPHWEDKLTKELADTWNNDVLPRVSGALQGDLSSYRQRATNVQLTTSGGLTAYGITEILESIDEALSQLQLNLGPFVAEYLQSIGANKRTQFNIGNGEFAKTVKDMARSYENQMITQATPQQLEVVKDIFEQLAQIMPNKKTGKISGQINQLFNTTVGERAVAYASDIGQNAQRLMTGQLQNVRGKDAKPDAIVKSLVSLENLCNGKKFSETINIGLNVKWYGKTTMRNGQTVPFSATKGYTLESTTLERALFPYVKKMVAANKLVHLGNEARDEAKLIIGKNHLPSAFMGSGSGIFNSSGTLIPGVKDTAVLFVANGRAYSILDLLNNIYRQLSQVTNSLDMEKKTGISIEWKEKSKVKNRFEPIDGVDETVYTEAIKRSDLLYSALLGTAITIKFAPGQLFAGSFGHMLQ